METATTLSEHFSTNQLRQFSRALIALHLFIPPGPRKCIFRTSVRRTALQNSTTNLGLITAFANIYLWFLLAVKYSSQVNNDLIILIYVHLNQTGTI